MRFQHFVDFSKSSKFLSDEKLLLVFLISSCQVSKCRIIPDINKKSEQMHYYLIHFCARDWHQTRAYNDYWY
jgi:hypothetical protein